MATIFESLSKSTKKVTTLVGAGLDFALVKARNAVKDETTKHTFQRKAIAADIDLIGYSSTYIEKGTLVSFDMLRQIAERDMIVVATIGKLTNRVAAFAHPQEDKHSLGFHFKPNPEVNGTEDDVDDEESKDDDKKKDLEVGKLVKFVMNTGTDKHEIRPRPDRMSLETFLRLIVKDRLIYNQVGIECIPTKDGESIVYFLPISGGSVRFITPQVLKQLKDPKGILYDPNTGPYGSDEQSNRLEKNEDTDMSEVVYAQVYKGQVYAVFTEKELVYKQGVPSVDLAHAGYAPGELEFLINAVANHRIAESHNERFFRFGYGSNGILNIKADVTEEDMQAIKRQFQRQYQGVRNAFKMPIMASKEGIEFINTGGTNRDMEWSSWMEYLIKIITAVYGISPSEINFDISRGTGSSSLSDGGQRNEVMLRDTRNSMLRPLLRWIESIFNDEILPRFDKDLAKKYIFEFIGLDQEDLDVELDRNKKKVTTYMTVNEIREQEGKEPLGEEGDIILDSIYYQWKALLKQQAQGGTDAPQTPDEGNENSTSEAEDGKEDVDSIINDIFSDSADTAKSKLAAFKKSAAKSDPKLVRVEFWGNKQ